jgi:hypothetical protein
MSFVMSVFCYIFMEQIGFHLAVFMKSDTWAFLKKSVQKIQISLKSDENNEHFTWRPLNTFDHISLNFSYKEKYLRQILEKIKTYVLIIKFSCPLLHSVEKYCKAGKATYDNMMLAHFTLGNTNKYSRAMCNTNWFSTVIIFARTRLIVIS